jgi:CBS domain-containing protein
MICPRCGFDNLPGQNECRRCLCDLTSLDRPAPQDRVESSLMQDTVGKLGSGPPVTVPLGTSVAQAVQILIDKEVGALLIVDQSGLLVGIFSERDLLVKVAGADKELTALPIEQFMTPKPQTVGPDDKLAFALHKMDVGGYRHLPVVRDGRPIGVLSVRDLIRHITRIVSGH